MRRNTKLGRRVLPGIWQLNQTTFIVRAQPVDPDSGRRVNLRRVLEGSTRSEAIVAREQLLLRFTAPPNRAPVHAVPTRPTSSTSLETLGSFGKRWLRRKIARGDINPNTVDRYRHALGHLSPRLLRAPVVDVTPVAALDRFSPRTINSWRAVIGVLFNDARRPFGLLYNPCEEVKALAVPVDLDQPNALPPRQLRWVLAHLDQHEDPMLAAVAWTMAFTGTRWQEVTAFRWEDLDRAAGVLHVRRKVVKTRLVPSTKTGKRRWVGVSPHLLAVLERYREHYDRRVGRIGRESGLMFPTRAGKPLHSGRMSIALRKACVALGIEQRLTSHGLRRSMTDLLRLAKVDPVIAKAIVGHSTDRMREHYSTVSEAEARHAAEAVENLLFLGATESA